MEQLLLLLFLNLRPQHLLALTAAVSSLEQPTPLQPVVQEIRPVVLPVEVPVDRVADPVVLDLADQADRVDRVVPQVEEDTEDTDSSFFNLK